MLEGPCSPEPWKMNRGLIMKGWRELWPATALLGLGLLLV